MKNDSSIGIGLMSGTSLDGLDVVLCSFGENGDRYSYEILQSVDIPFDPELQERLRSSMDLSGRELMILDHDFALYCASHVNRLIKKWGVIPHYIASHGHTVFHEPSRGITSQIGSGAVIAAQTGITTISDFRSTDVALGGQGAPLVPVGDHLLFPDYDVCLNLGGIANGSFLKNNIRIAFDITVCNMALNLLAEQLGFPYDAQGNIAKSGTIIPEILMEINRLPYFNQLPPKSLGKEWFVQNIEPFLIQNLFPIPDLLATMVEHISFKISEILPQKGSVLVTGGGALNAFLIDSIRAKTEAKIVLPQLELIQFKEALVFAFLGYLRLQNECNVWSDVTGASRNSCSGAVYLGS